MDPVFVLEKNLYLMIFQYRAILGDIKNKSSFQANIYIYNIEKFNKMLLILTIY